MEKLLIFSQSEDDKLHSYFLNEEISVESPLINYVKVSLKSSHQDLDGVEGEASGYTLNNLSMWETNETLLFIILDGYSQLLYELHNVLFEKSNLQNIMKNSNKTNKNDINGFFLNRIYCKNNTVENHKYFLKKLQETFDFIIYSFGSTELDDDFPIDYTDDFYEIIEEQVLTIDNGWVKDKDVDFYIWRR